MAVWVTHLSAAAVYALVFAWLFTESTGLPISDEPLLVATGALAHVGVVQFVPLVTCALAGKVSASALAYALGRRLDLMRLARPATLSADGPRSWPQSWLYLLRPTLRTAARVNRFFERYGGWSVLIGRLVPVVRSFISYPAGAAAMRFSTFVAATTAGSAIWIIGWILVGAAAGHVVVH